MTVSVADFIVGPLQEMMNAYCPESNVSVRPVKSLFRGDLICVKFPFLELFVFPHITDDLYDVFSRSNNLSNLTSEGVKFDRGYPKQYISALLDGPGIEIDDSQYLRIDNVHMDNLPVSIFSLLKVLIQSELTTKEDLDKPAKTPILLPIVNECASRNSLVSANYVRDGKGRMTIDYFSESTPCQKRCYFCGCSYLV